MVCAKKHAYTDALIRSEGEKAALVLNQNALRSRLQQAEVFSFQCFFFSSVYAHCKSALFQNVIFSSVFLAAAYDHGLSSSVSN